MNYPRFLNSYNLYVGGELIKQDEECPAHPQPSAAAYKPYSEVCLLPILVKETGRNGWKETKDSKDGLYQQGLRSVFEFRDGEGEEAVFFVRSAQADNLTNIAPSRL